MSKPNVRCILFIGCCVTAPLASFPLADLVHAGSAQASQGSKLGDLGKFRAIAVDVEKFVDKGELAAAKMRIKDLETQWDAAEAGLKPRAASDWHKVDKAIDAALDTLRADKPVQQECKKTILNVIKTLGGL